MRTKLDASEGAYFRYELRWKGLDLNIVPGTGTRSQGPLLMPNATARCPLTHSSVGALIGRDNDKMLLRKRTSKSDRRGDETLSPFADRNTM